uniref:DUF4371 domain-containing protein n=1 Tax=Trichogramma kaykai TaxID=54128 RepID=A0ABD2XBD5_9HYME
MDSNFLEPYSNTDLNEQNYNHKTTFESIVKRYEELKNIFTPVNETGTRVRCYYCHDEDTSIYSRLMNEHKNSRMHLENLKKKNKNYSETEKKVALLQLQLVLVNVERNASFLYTDYLVPMLKETVTDSEIIKNLQLCRWRTKAIVCGVLAPQWKLRLLEILKCNKFSIIVDESTDVTVEKSMCIIVRFYDPSLKKIVEVIWDLIKIYEHENSSCDAVQTTERILKSFEGIPLTNMVAYCSDTCHVMMGPNNSVAQKLKETIPGIIIVKCSCHIENLCTRRAISHIPLKYKNLVTDISNYINSSSSRRLNQWFFEQEKLDLQATHILKPSFTRWLSFCDCLRSMLRKWIALLNYFKKEAKVDKGAEEIYEVYFVLSKFSKTNEDLQSVSTFFYEDRDAMSNLFCEIASLYINQTYILNNKVEDINPNDKEHWKDMYGINVGIECLCLLNKSNTKINDDQRKEFFKSCQQFCQKQRVLR